MNTDWWRAILPPNDTRFDEIAPKYFFMTKNEAKKLDKEDFFNMISSETPKSERIKLIVFIRNYWPFRKNSNCHESDSDDDEEDNFIEERVIANNNFEIAEDCLNKKTGYWHLSDVVKSQVFGMSNFLTLNVISSFPSFPSFDLIRIIDLSSCSLMDEDMPHLAIVVDRCKNLLELNISNSRVAGKYNGKSNPVVYGAVVDWLIKLKILNISITPLATLESLNLFESFPDEFFERLIFVPKNWLSGMNWRPLCRVSSGVCSDAYTNLDTRVEIALKTHNNYYVSKSNNNNN